MKLGIFTDPHYSSAALTCGRRYNSRSLDKIRAALAEFSRAGCAMAVCLGDLIDREDDHAKEAANLGAVAAEIAASGLRVIVVMGNHDGFCFTPDEFYAILGEACRPRTMALDGRTLVFADACHYAAGGHYRPDGSHDWTDTFLPESELAALAEALRNAEAAHVFLHQNVDAAIREDHRVGNAAAARALLDAPNVIGVHQGHYHPGCENGKYHTYPAMCERDDAAFVVEI